jgi:hypothetical protein
LECRNGWLEDSAVPLESAWRCTEQAGAGAESLVAGAQYIVVETERWSEETLVPCTELENTRRLLVRSEPCARQSMGGYGIGGARPGHAQERLDTRTSQLEDSSA